MLTTAQAADVLGVSRRTMEGWRVRGGGPQYVQPGPVTGRRCAVRYRESDLRDYIASRIRESTSATSPPTGRAA